MNRAWIGIAEDLDESGVLGAPYPRAGASAGAATAARSVMGAAARLEKASTASNQWPLVIGAGVLAAVGMAVFSGFQDKPVPEVQPVPVQAAKPAKAAPSRADGGTAQSRPAKDASQPKAAPEKKREQPARPKPQKSEQESVAPQRPGAETDAPSSARDTDIGLEQYRSMRGRL